MAILTTKLAFFDNLGGYLSSIPPGLPGWADEMARGEGDKVFTPGLFSAENTNE